MLRSISKISPMLLVIILLVGGFFWWPRYENFKDLKSRVAQKEKEAIMEANFSADIKETLKKLENYKEETERIESAIPDDPSIPELFNFIQSESRYNGLILTNIQADRIVVAETNPDMEKALISVSLSGAYPSIKNFLSSLHRNVRLIGVDSVSLTPVIEEKEGEEKKISFNFNLILKAYSQKTIDPSESSQESLDLKF